MCACGSLPQCTRAMRVLTRASLAGSCSAGTSCRLHSPAAPLSPDCWGSWAIQAVGRARDAREPWQATPEALGLQPSGCCSVLCGLLSRTAQQGQRLALRGALRQASLVPERFRMLSVHTGRPRLAQCQGRKPPRSCCATQSGGMQLQREHAARCHQSLISPWWMSIAKY